MAKKATYVMEGGPYAHCRLLIATTLCFSVVAQGVQYKGYYKDRKWVDVQ